MIQIINLHDFVGMTTKTGRSYNDFDKNMNGQQLLRYHYLLGQSAEYFGMPRTFADCEGSVQSTEVEFFHRSHAA